MGTGSSHVTPLQAWAAGSGGAGFHRGFWQLGSLAQATWPKVLAVLQALARVLAQSTPLLLLDEPTAALDLRHQELVLRLCRERAAAGDAVVLVLHDLTLAAAYADRTAVLHDGRVAATGTPSEVYDEKLLGDVYRQPVEVLSHPRTGTPIVIPCRNR